MCFKFGGILILCRLEEHVARRKMASRIPANMVTFFRIASGVSPRAVFEALKRVLEVPNRSEIGAKKRVQKMGCPG